MSVTVKIVSDGTSRGTQVYTSDGEPITGVQAVTWTCTEGGRAQAIIELNDVGLDVQGILNVLSEGDIDELERICRENPRSEDRLMNYLRDRQETT